MIVAKVRLMQPKDRNKFINESPINEWLLANVGTHAKFRNMVDESRPWHVDHNFGEVIYSFARERDATMFALRWV